MFRTWATQTIKQPTTQGYTINQSRVETNPIVLIEQKVHHNAILELINQRILIYRFFVFRKDIINTDLQILIHHVILISIASVYQYIGKLKLAN